MVKFIPALAACLIVASPAVAQSTSSEQAPKPAKPAKAKIICETEEQIGSRLGGKRVCHTAEEWEQIRSDTRQNLEKFQQQGTGTPRSG